MQEVESRAAYAVENGLRLAFTTNAAGTSAGRTDDGVEMRPLPDVPASAPFWYQVCSRHCHLETE